MALQDMLNHNGTKECNFVVEWFVHSAQMHLAPSLFSEARTLLLHLSVRCCCSDEKKKKEKFC